MICSSFGSDFTTGDCTHKIDENLPGCYVDEGGEKDEEDEEKDEDDRTPSCIVEDCPTGDNPCRIPICKENSCDFKDRECGDTGDKCTVSRW